MHLYKKSFEMKTTFKITIFSIADRAMQVSYSPLPRIWAFIKASIFSPLNGWAVPFNNKKTLETEGFMRRVTTDTSLSQTLPHLSIPVLLIYAENDLHAPVEVGQSIYQGISTPESQKTLLILPNSRHGTEGNDVLLMKAAIKAFINQKSYTLPLPGDKNTC